MSEQEDIAIIGGGASGTLLAHALMRQHGRTCLVIDPSAQPALGVAYSTRCIGHLLNVPASGMSGLAENHDHFVEWLHRQIDPGIDPNAFMPRALYGLYLHHLLHESGARLKQDRVISCKAEGGRFRLSLASGETIHARSVVLALGHFSPARLGGLGPGVFENPRYHHDVWQHAALQPHHGAAKAIAAFAPEATLLMIGSGLTAIDMVIKARLEGHTGPIRLLSRHASLPEKHLPPAPPLPPVIVPQQRDARLRHYVHQFHEALRRGVAWRDAIDSLRPVTNDLWSRLSAQDHARFNRHLRRRWDVARHRIAPRIADFLKRELRTGALVIDAGRVTRIEAEPHGLMVTAIHRGKTTHYRADHVLNCTGPDLDYRRAGSDLLDDLLAQGLACPGEGGAGLNTHKDGRLTDLSGNVGPALYTLGPARLGTLFESIAIPEIRQQAYDLATSLNASLATLPPARQPSC